PGRAPARAGGPGSVRRDTRGRNRRAGRAPEGKGRKGRGARSGRLPCALARGVAEDLAQLGERERLVQVRPVETLQELEGVAARRVAGGEDDSVRGARVPAGELGVHLAARKVRHAEGGAVVVE